MVAITTNPAAASLEVFQPPEKGAAANVPGTANPAGDQWAILAGMRFVMAFIVLVSHTNIVVGCSNFVYRAVNAFDSYAAVAAFFVISGYSIASSLQRDASHFYARRFWRIYPVYVAAFTMSILAFVFFGTLGVQITLPFSSFTLPQTRDALGVLLFLQGICVPLLTIDAPIWTIGIEGIYYALAPLFQRCHTGYLAAAIAMSSIIYGSGFLPFHRGYHEGHWASSATVWLCFWLLGFEFYRSRGIWRWTTLLLPVALICLNHEGGVLAPFTLASAMLLLVHAPNITLGNERLRYTLNYLGDLSYPLYLIHYPVFVWVWEVFHTRQILVHIAAALMVSAAVLALIDKPLRGAWKKISDLRVIALLVTGILLVAYAGLSFNARIQRAKLREFGRLHPWSPSVEMLR